MVASSRPRAVRAQLHGFSFSFSAPLRFPCLLASAAHCLASCMDGDDACVHCWQEARAGLHGTVSAQEIQAASSHTVPDGRAGKQCLSISARRALTRLLPGRLVYRRRRRRGNRHDACMDEQAPDAQSQSQPSRLPVPAAWTWT